jgi:outer membrane protein OmpA-like peptidoglycan-associated protein
MRYFSLERFVWLLVIFAGMFAVVFCSSRERGFESDPMMSLSKDRPKYQKPVEDDMPPLDFKLAFFDTDKATLREDAKRALKPTADYLKAHKDIVVQLEGFCDKRGSDAYNLELGERRAQAAKEFIVAQGVDPKRISVLSYGKMEGDSDSAMAQNRRAGVVVIFPK